jgi:hypothetical protein
MYIISVSKCCVKIVDMAVKFLLGYTNIDGIQHPLAFAATNEL